MKTKTTALGIVDAELAAMSQARDDAARIIAAEEQRLVELEIQVRALQKVRNQISRAEGATDDQGAGRLGAREAVLEYLRSHPRSKTDEVVANVVPIIKTASRNPDRLIVNTILQLIKKGRIVRGAAPGKELSIAEQPKPVAERNGHV
jgi:hypothetical protein